MPITPDPRFSITGTFAGLTGAQLKVIDLSETPLKPNVVREGKQVPFVRLDPKIVDEVVKPGVIVPPAQAPRVVSQSIPPGTKVARGASVDLVLAPRTRIPIDIVAGVHAGFSQLTVDNVVSTFLVNPQVAGAVLDFETPQQVPAATRQLIERELEQNQITIDRDNPSLSFEAAFATLKGAAAFM